MTDTLSPYDAFYKDDTKSISLYSPFIYPK